ncbi:MAG: hypothetical protein US80_C0001G0054 [Candidatus Daviesbacteria bacterium GW2011_GWA2_38_17]|uniref:Uncharacterized protein n=1 Tax=Candidatus Daviesbacteria bacterium GW2011_GWF2_38_6 TaxID=1618432 RepID=A0A0G0KBW3_9BACT|nr:MAG: hypothetical protein US80_C0001G0054 [Candidatus Daviesbacteria bacterium GW2011_GWA2_38_17]KKQ77118.1 MAG: hypothetical protein US99_C0048G0004 [Candidatus Daviesbacteria bacterium GW2011_GWF2_38_6]
MKPLNILIIAILIYLVWAIWHHRRDKSLTLVILMEYILLAGLVLILILGIYV